MSIASKIDNTLLKPDATIKEINDFICRSAEYNFNSVCLYPSFVAAASKILKGRTRICTVIGFPNGSDTIKSKMYSAQEAVSNGAAIIDMVFNIGYMKSGEYVYIENEISAVREIIGVNELRVIIETAYLTREEIIKASNLAVKSGADCVKTSTGFASRGAITDDIMIIREAIQNRASIKASGGIRDFESAVEMIRNGADYIGTSKGIEIVNDFQSKGVPLNDLL